MILQPLHRLIFCTCPDKLTAERLAHILVKEKLAACVNVLPNITSIYRWEGDITTNDECLLLIKTTSERYEELEKTLKAAHPYEVPEIIAMDINQGLPAYLDWVTIQCNK